MDNSTQSAQQFVYVFRDTSGYPIYIGRGTDGDRPLAHFGDKAHNEELSKLILRESVTVQMAGPFGSQHIAEIVEGALISAFRLTPAIGDKLTNKNLGASSGRFRPLGVPSEFVERASLPPLTRADLVAAAAGFPIISVLITKKQLRDGRHGFDLALANSEHDIIEQMVKWWPIGRKIRQRWEAEPSTKPGLLIAMSGSLRHRVIVGALEIDREITHWHASSQNPDRFEIPTRYTPALDFAALRGRVVGDEVGRSQESGIRIIE